MNQIRFDNQVAQLVTRDRKVLNAVYDSLVYYRPGYEFTKAFKEGRWDGKICLLNRAKWTFPAGLVRWVREIIHAKGIDVEIVDVRDQSRCVPSLPNDVIENVLEDKKAYDFQVKGVRRAFAISRGVIQSPTGSGKTVMAAMIAKLGLEHSSLNTLFIVNRKKLMHQTRESFIKSGIDAGIVGDSERVLRPVTVATVQTLYAGFEKRDHLRRITKPADPQIMALLARTDIIILDEAHNGDAEGSQVVIAACRNAYYRFGLTATPLMKGVESDIKLMCATGNVIYRIPLVDLIKKGILAQPYIKLHKITRPQLKTTRGKSLPYPSAYKRGVVENDSRNELVIQEALTLAGAGETVLILVSQINHGNRLQSMFREYPHLKTKFIHGSKTDEERDSALDELADGRYQILISSTITDEGVDIPNISAVILAGGGKSPIKLYQRIGRAMRKKIELNRALIVLFLDLTNKHLAKHSMRNLQVIKDEPGFIVVPDFKTLLRIAA